MFFFDSLYIWIFLITIAISLGAQLLIRSAYGKWSKVRNGANLTGLQVGQRLIRETSLGGSPVVPDVRASAEGRRLGQLRRQGVVSQGEYEAKMARLQAQAEKNPGTSSNLSFGRMPGKLSDNYDPRTHTVNLSDDIANRPSVAAMAIVAHELGHAQQHENNSILISARNVLVPAVTISPRIAYILIFAGIVFNFTGALWLGIFFYALMVLFSVLTLPVEIDASRRGLNLLREASLMQTEDDASGSRRVLTAAASTYIAAAVTAILNLLYYISIARRRG